MAQPFDSFPRPAAIVSLDNAVARTGVVAPATA
jgi:hypothetical protein